MNSGKLIEELLSAVKRAEEAAPRAINERPNNAEDIPKASPRALAKDGSPTNQKADEAAWSERG